MKHVTEKMPIKAGKYDKVPENYTGIIYICPMHPEVRDVEKSDCPICSMFLQPEDEIDDASHMEHNHSENHHGHNHEHSHEHNHTHGHGTDTSNNEVNSVTGGK